MEIEKRNQSLMERSPILESRRPPSPRVFYPGSPGQSAQSESPSFISDQSPRGDGGQSAPAAFDQSRPADVRKDLFNKHQSPSKEAPGGEDGLEPCPVDNENGVRTFDYRPHTVQPVQFSIQPPKKFIDYSISNTNPLDHQRSKKSPPPSRQRQRSRSPRHKKAKKSKHRSRSSSPSHKRSKTRHRGGGIERRKSEAEEEKDLEPNDDLYEPDSGNDDIGYVPGK